MIPKERANKKRMDMQTCKLSYIFNSFIGAPPFDTTIEYTTMSLLKNAKSYFFLIKMTDDPINM